MITNPLLHRTRRHFFKDCGIGLGKIALASMLAKESFGAMGNPGFMRFPVKSQAGHLLVYGRCTQPVGTL